MLLAGDLGGTKTKLGIFSNESGPRKPIVEAKFPSTRYPQFEDILKEFTGKTDIKIKKAVFGIAGPVIKDKVLLTNLSWIVEKSRLQELLQLQSVQLLNDLEALGHALPELDAQDMVALNEGKPDTEGNIAIIAPGTGLGEGFLVKTDRGYKPCSSEGGHADFAPRNPLEIELLQHLAPRFNHVGYETVCSGSGIQNIYSFLKEKKRFDEPSWLAEILSQASDPNPVIFENALDAKSNCELCKSTVDVFVSILGAEAGNLALKVKATRGVYLAGGIAPRIIPVLKQGKFMKAFKQKGNMSYLLNDIPVHVIENPDAVLIGAARYGLKIL